MNFTPGIFLDIAFRDYVGIPAVNAPLLQLINTSCPAAAHFASWKNPDRPPRESNATMDAGAIAHQCLLEGTTDRIEVIDPNEHPAKTTGAIPEGWTNQSIRRARDNAILEGKIPILKNAFGAIREQVEVARDFIASLEKSEPAIHAAFQAGGGASEVSMMWDDDGVPCKIRPDRISTDHTVIVDYKTGDGSAEPNAWSRQMVRMGYYQSAAFYARGVRALTGKKYPAYIFLVQENDPPYLCSLVGVDEQSFDLGDQQITHALKLWRACERDNRWPEYPPRVCYPVLPPWEIARWEEHAALGNAYDPAQMWGDTIKRMAREDDPA